jgi:hypothetical protein
MTFGVKLVVAMSLSLFLSSIFISFFLVNMYGVNYQNGITLPNQGDILYSSSQDFKNGIYNLSTLSKTGYTSWVYNANVGMVLSGLGAYRNWFLIDNLQKSEGNTYVNYYYINNSVENDYSIALRYTDGYDSNVLQVKSDGFHIPYYGFLGLAQSQDLDFIPYPNANKVHEVFITTKYTDGKQNCEFLQACQHIQEPYLEFTFNGNTFITRKLNYPDNPLDYSDVYYAGVQSDIIGFTIESFKTDNAIVNTNESGILDNIVTFLGTMLKIVSWSLPSSVMPLGLQVVLIGTQEFCLLIGLVAMARGV